MAQPALAISSSARLGRSRAGNLQSSGGTSHVEGIVELTMLVARRHLVAIVFASAAIVACGSGDSTSSDSTSSDSTSSDFLQPFGKAHVEPQEVGIGDAFSIDPADEIQPLCLNVLTVLRETDSGELEREAWLSSDGQWQQFGREPVPTVAACLPGPSASSRSYTVPDEMERGSYIVCLSAEPDEAGCGRITVTG